METERQNEKKTGETEEQSSAVTAEDVLEDPVGSGGAEKIEDSEESRKKNVTESVSIETERQTENKTGETEEQSGAVIAETVEDAPVDTVVEEKIKETEESRKKTEEGGNESESTVIYDKNEFLCEVSLNVCETEEDKDLRGAFIEDLKPLLLGQGDDEVDFTEVPPDMDLPAVPNEMVIGQVVFPEGVSIGEVLGAEGVQFTGEEGELYYEEGEGFEDEGEEGGEEGEDVELLEEGDEGGEEGEDVELLEEGDEGGEVVEVGEEGEEEVQEEEVQEEEIQVKEVKKGTKPKESRRKIEAPVQESRRKRAAPVQESRKLPRRKKTKLPAASSSLQSQVSQVVPAHPPKKYKCLQCQYSTNYMADLNNHRNTHSGDWVYCPVCNKGYKSQKSMKVHFKTHTGQTRGLCGIGGCTFGHNDFGVIQAHQYEIHGPQYGKCNICPVCNRKFSNIRTLDRHLRNVHEDKTLKCPVCGKNYKSRPNMERHISVEHKGADKIVCHLCGNYFTSVDSLANHLFKAHPEDK